MLSTVLNLSADGIIILGYCVVALLLLRYAVALLMNVQPGFRNAAEAFLNRFLRWR